MAALKNSQYSFVDQIDGFSEQNQNIRFGKNKSESALDKYTSVADLGTYSESFKSRSLSQQSSVGEVTPEIPDTSSSFRVVPNRSFRNNPTGTPIRDNLGYEDHSYSETSYESPYLGAYEPYDEPFQSRVDNSPFISGKPKYRVSDSSFSFSDDFGAESTVESTFSRKDPFKTYTEAGGGATFHHEYTKDGDLKTKKVVLNKFKDRTDKQGFKPKAANFLDKAGRAVEAVKPENEEAAASNVDQKAILATVIAKGLLDDQIDRYGKIQKQTKKEIKQLKREIRDSSSATSPEESPFLSSQVSFKDETGSFTDRYMGMFREEGKDYKGHDYFELVSAENSGSVDPRNVAAIRKSLENKFGREKRSSSSSSTDSKFTDETSFEKVDAINGNARIDYEVGNSKENVDRVNTKFSKTTIGDDENKGKKSVDSYFNDGKPKSSKSKEEQLEIKKSEKKATDKAKKKAQKKAATIAAVSNMLRMKKEMQNSIGNMSGEVSGDLLKDGSAGMLRAIVDGFKSFIVNKVRGFILKAVAAIFGGILTFITSFLPILLPIICVVGLISSFLGVFTDTEIYEDGDGLTYYSLSEAEIDEIIENVRLAYPYDFNSTQEDILRYSLSKVGCEYNQAYHARTDIDIFDCSSLAYRSYKEVGIDISNNGIFTASEECRMADNSGHTADDLLPGDLIFYGGSSNGRYKGVYHVAIYVGNGKMVEAKGRNYGVVYGDVRTNNVVTIGRYAA